MKPNDFDEAAKSLKLPEDLCSSLRLNMVSGMSLNVSIGTSGIAREVMVKNRDRVADEVERIKARSAFQPKTQNLQSS